MPMPFLTDWKGAFAFTSPTGSLTRHKDRVPVTKSTATGAEGALQPVLSLKPLHSRMSFQHIYEGVFLYLQLFVAVPTET